MPRPPRIVIPNCPHHITQRGNKKEDVFFSPGDQEIYLKLLRKYCSEYGVSILGYCLMTNHVHIVATPSCEDGLSRAIGLTHNDYSRWLHVQRNECGHLWQTRFYSCPVEERYLWTVLAYVERNPVRAGLVQHAEHWAWSSARTHLAEVRHSPKADNWLDLNQWASQWTPPIWRVALQDGITEADIHNRLREATRTGRPFADEPFIEKLEQVNGISLRRQKPGPKPAAKSQQA